MKKVIEEMLSGKTCRLHDMANNEYYNKIVRKVEELYGKLLKELTEEQAKLVEELYNSMIEMEGETCAFHFSEGFKLGISVVFEAIE